MTIFADDTTIYHAGTNQTEVYRNMNSDLEPLSDWFKANKLSVNASKTKCMVFKCKRSMEAQTTQPDLYIDNEVLEKVPVTKFLGVYIYENLDWIEHIDFVKNKISGGIYALNYSKNFLSNANMRTLYYSLVHPYLPYGIILWGSTYNKYTHKLYVLQKKALRVMHNTTYTAQSMPLFEKSGILRIQDMYNLQLGVLMYKFTRQELSRSLMSLYEHSTTPYDTRHGQYPILPNYTTNLVRRTCRGPNMWRKLADAVTKVPGSLPCGHSKMC